MTDPNPVRRLVQVGSIDPFVLGIEDACRFCGNLSRTTMYRAARQGLVVAYKATLVGTKAKSTRLLFDRESLIRFVESFQRADAPLRRVEADADRILAAVLGGRQRGRGRR